ncbi:hypothetical protein EBU99_12835 [bacterium]|nr:hypothetical protein [bacterium]
MYSALLATHSSLAAYEFDGQLKSWCWPRKDAFHNQLRFFIMGIAQGDQAIWLDPERDQISFAWLTPLEHLQIQWHVHHPDARGLRVRMEAKLIDECTLEHTYVISAHEHSTLRSTRLWFLMAPEVAGRRTQFQCVRASTGSNAIRCDSDPYFLTLQTSDGCEFKNTGAAQIDSQHSLGQLVQSFLNHPHAYRSIEMGRCAAIAVSPVLHWEHPFTIRMALHSALDSQFPSSPSSELSNPLDTRIGAPMSENPVASSSQRESGSSHNRSELSLSLRVLDALTGPNGALLASAECDWDMRYSGGYGFVWPRDAAFTGLALVECGHIERAERIARFLAKALADADDFEQRYTDAAQPAPSWCYRQPDQRPLVCMLWIALLNSAKLSDDALRKTLRAKLNVCLAAMADELLASPATALFGFDLWEEREGQHFFALVAAFGALHRGAELAHTDAAAERFLQAAKVASQLAQAHFSPLHPWPARTRTPSGQLDFTADASLLSCLMPVPEFPLTTEQRQGMFTALQTALQHGVGFRRYVDDAYRGGGCWPLVGLWFALGAQEVLPAKEAKSFMMLSLRQAAAASTPLGYLPEQIDPTSSLPSWVVPLAWSHAFFLQLSQRAQKASELQKNLEETGVSH